MSISKTKFRPPILRQPMMPRPQLTEAFIDKCPLTVVSAPAGSGKTTVVLEGHAANKTRLVWISLDPDDNDPIRFIHGLLLPIINGSFGATLQATIAPDMQGRAFAFIMSAAMLVSPLALMIAGPFADRFGIQLWFRVAGITCATMGMAGLFIHDVMRMEEEKQETAQEPS